MCGVAVIIFAYVAGNFWHVFCNATLSAFCCQKIGFVFRCDCTSVVKRFRFAAKVVVLIAVSLQRAIKVSPACSLHLFGICLN